jgi:hypothetical protein
VPSVRAAILDIVVDEREIVEDLNGGGDWRRHLDIAASRGTAELRHQRANSLALDERARRLIGFSSGRINPPQVEPGHPGQKGSASIEVVRCRLQLHFE